MVYSVCTWCIVCVAYGKGLRPGDVLTAANGKTVEVSEFVCLCVGVCELGVWVCERESVCERKRKSVCVLWVVSVGCVC